MFSRFFAYDNFVGALDTRLCGNDGRHEDNAVIYYDRYP